MLEALDYTDEDPGVLKVPDGRLQNSRLYRRRSCVFEVPDRRLQKRSMPAKLDYEELGGLSDLGQWDCPRARNIPE